MRYFLTALMVMSLFSCIPDSDHPLTAPGEQEIDKTVIGTWFWKEEKDSGYIHIGMDDKLHLLRLLMVEIESDGEIEISEFTGHTSVFQGRRYLNLKWERPDQEVPGYIFVKYDLKDASLGISFINTDVVEKGIKNHALKGTVTKGEWLSSIHITDTGKNIQAFFMKNDSGLFADTKYLPKLTLPENAMPK